MKKIIYYKDELNDEFSRKKIIPRKIDKNYKYINNSLWWKTARFFLYRIIATPIAYVYCRSKFKVKFIGREIFKNIKTGFFLYGNHTQDIADAFMPSLITFPRSTYVIVHPNNVSMKFLGKITPYLGALPLPDDIDSSRNFINAIDQRIKENNCIMIYPEAHIWPYYTSIRNYSSKSFRYPVKYNLPSYCITTTYQCKKNKPVITVYCDGPFYPDKSLGAKESQEKLRNEIYNTMLYRCKNSTFEYVKYIKED